MYQTQYERVKRKAIELAILILGLVAGMSIDSL